MSVNQVVRILGSADLDALRTEFAEYVLWCEQTPRRAQYVARCLHLHASPHTIVTTDLAELREALHQGRSSQPDHPRLPYVPSAVGTEGRFVPTSRGLIQAARDLMTRTVDLPASQGELLGILGEYRRLLFALTVQGVDL